MFNSNCGANVPLVASLDGNNNGMFGGDGWWAIIIFALIFGWGGNGFGGLPKRMPLAFAAAIPSACRCLMFVLSFSATKDSNCNTKSLINVPSRSFPRRVSNNGMSIT